MPVSSRRGEKATSLDAPHAPTRLHDWPRALIDPAVARG